MEAATMQSAEQASGGREPRGRDPGGRDPGGRDPGGREPGIGALRAILAFSIVSTALHYTHNFVAVEDYPDSSIASDASTQVGVLISWPLLTAIGLIGYRLYSRGRFRVAHAALLTYSLTGLITIGHFLDGVPDIPAFWFATIFTDFAAGLAMLAFVAWSSRAPEVAAARG
jgi:hypothetical protein